MRWVGEFGEGVLEVLVEVSISCSWSDRICCYFPHRIGIKGQDTYGILCRIMARVRDVV